MRDPFDIGDDGEAFEMAPVFHADHRVFERGVRGVPVKLRAETHQDARLAMLGDSGVDRRLEHVLVVVTGDLARCINGNETGWSIFYEREHTEHMGTARTGRKCTLRKLAALIRVFLVFVAVPEAFDATEEAFAFGVAVGAGTVTEFAQDLFLAG